MGRYIRWFRAGLIASGPTASSPASRRRLALRLLSFGVTVLPDPPASRVVELLSLAEQTRLRVRLDVRLAHPLARPVPAADDGGARDVDAQARAQRHEPGHARADGHRQRVRDAPGDLRRPHGDRHRPRRLGAPDDRPQAGEGRRVRAFDDDDQGARERQAGALERLRRPPRVGTGPAGDSRLHRRLRAARARRRRADCRRRDHPARRPGDHRVDRRAGEGRCGGGRARPVRDQGHGVRAGARVRRHGRRVRAGALVPRDGLEPRLRPAREARQGDAAARPHRLRRAHAAGAVRLLRAQPRRRRARPAGVRRDVRALLRPRHARAARREAAGASKPPASTSGTSTS